MLHLSNAQVRALVAPAAAQLELEQAFRALGEGQASVQPRRRMAQGSFKLSVMEAVLGHRGVAGAKVYSTLSGTFHFVIVLFAMDSGLPLAIVDGEEVTRLRTAATTVLAARHLARSDSRTIAVLGAGEQGCEHAEQLGTAFDAERILVGDVHVSARTRARLAERVRRPVVFCPVEEALARADVLVLASRSTQPLFRGEQLAPGCFVAAVGATLPSSRELDDVALRRAAAIAVEWPEQALDEAADLGAAKAGGPLESRMVALSELLTGRHPGRRGRDDITIYKSVGIALEDVAVAALAYRLHVHGQDAVQWAGGLDTGAPSSSSPAER